VITNNEIKFIKSLHQKKVREQEGLFLVEGEKMVQELLQHTEWEVVLLVGTESWLSANSFGSRIKYHEVKNDVLERITALQTPNQVLALVRSKRQEFSLEKAKHSTTLFLDDVRDPGNLGTIIRIADWFGIPQIVCSPQSVELYNPKTVQSTMGSLFRVSVSYSDLVDLSLALHSEEIPLFGAVMEGKDIAQVNFPSSMVLVMGSESHGIGPQLESRLDHRITIPRIGKAESLNVAVATGIICSKI
jgi:TrmH family RNA methyltransferase